MSDDQAKQSSGQTPQPPLQTLRDGGAFAKLWERQGEKGRFVAIEVGRTYKDQDGAFKETSSFSRTGLMKLEGVIRQANTEAQKWEEYYRVQDRDQNAEQPQLAPQPRENEQPAELPQPTMSDQRDQVLASARAQEPSMPEAPDRTPDQ